MNTTSTQSGKDAARKFATAFASAVSDALSKAIGSSWPVQVMSGSEPPTRNAQPVQFSLKVSGALSGECFIEFYEPAVSELGVRSGGNGEDTVAEHAKLVAGILKNASSGLSAALSAEYGDLTFGFECVSGLAFGGMFVVPLSAPADSSNAPILLYFDGSLMRAFSSGDAKRNPNNGLENAFNPANLKLVLDVELNVSLRFGQRQLPLREVLELSSGSVVELDRMVDENVELLLDGKVVARGEAVIVDGNYGLRVTEIPQAMETHFSR